jgi:dTMP kinase
MIGKLIVLDGTDGSGKATQTKKLLARLIAEKFAAETLDFPQYENNFFGRLVRRFVDGEFGKPADINPYLATVIYAADRFQSSGKIKQWLTEGKIVVLDRYASANQIHQGSKIIDDAEREKFLNWLDEMEFGVFGIPRPDLVIYLDVSTATAQGLMHNRGGQDKTENDIAHQVASREQSLRLISKLNNWQRIICEENGQILPIDAIHEKIWAAVTNMI